MRVATCLKGPRRAAAKLQVLVTWLSDGVNTTCMLLKPDMGIWHIEVASSQWSPVSGTQATFGSLPQRLPMKYKEK